MDNLLVQACGRKRVTLFSPDDVDNLYLNGAPVSQQNVAELSLSPPGDKSEVIDIEATPTSAHFPLFARATQFETTLSPGDALFIPGTHPRARSKLARTLQRFGFTTFARWSSVLAATTRAGRRPS